MLSDAHIHLTDAAERLLADTPVRTVISCATPQECRRAAALAERFPYVHTSCGIHPWHVAADSWEIMLPWLEQAAVIGEIGLDSLWCSSDPALQRQLFERQLAFACERQRPVVLHTKGREGEVLAMIRHYPNTYHVHWYSCRDHLDDYLALGCYMSVGPFPSLDPAVAAVAVHTPDDRLLIETDGADAVRWATGDDQADYLQALERIADDIAVLRESLPAAVQQLADANLLRFLASGAAPHRSTKAPSV